MPPYATQSFELQRPELESCRAEAMLRLSLSLLLLYENTQPFAIRDRQELCVIEKNEVSCSDVAQNLDQKKLWS